MTLLTVVIDGWTISSSEFRAALEKRWPSATIIELDETSEFSLRWENADPEVWEGQFSRKGMGFAVEGTIQGAARLATWFRGLVPAEHEIWFVDVGNNAQVDVPPDIDAESLAAAYIAAANGEGDEREN